MKKIVILTGAGISAESGISTFRDSGGLWEQYSVEDVASIEGYWRNRELVQNFYNQRRRESIKTEPNDAHRLVAGLEKFYDVTVVTQNVDNLHEKAGSSNIIHLHGEMMKMCSSRDVDNPRYHVTLPHEGFGESGLEVPHGEKAGDGSLLRPFIVFFEENVPNMYDAAQEAQKADIFIIIGTSLNVYPAAGLVQYCRPGIPMYLIDPNAVATRANLTHIKKGASEGMAELIKILGD